jgi:hypothetical protein
MAVLLLSDFKREGENTELVKNLTPIEFVEIS